jgi:ABC-2 type transport system permease protein
MTMPATTATASPASMLLEQARAEFLRYLRSPILSVFTIALPIVLYLFVGLSYAGRTVAGIPGPLYALAGFGAYAVANVMLSTFGIGLAADRARRMDVLMRATPLRPAVFLAGRAIVAVVFGLVSLSAVSLFAVVTGAVSLSPATWAALAGWLMLGSLPFLALGLAIGYLVNPNAGGVAVNLVALPLYFAAGVFRPISQLPQLIQHVAPYLPSYRYAQLAWSAVGATNTAPLVTNLAFLAVWTVALALLALRAYRREQSRRFA